TVRSSRLKGWRQTTAARFQKLPWLTGNLLARWVGGRGSVAPARCLRGIIRPAGRAALHHLASNCDAVVLSGSFVQTLTLAREPLPGARLQLVQRGFAPFLG